MPNESATIVQKLWNYCNVLRDDGVSYGDYVEQLTYLLFLKMADEQTKPPFSKPSIIPKLPRSQLLLPLIKSTKPMQILIASCANWRKTA